MCCSACFSRVRALPAQPSGPSCLRVWSAPRSRRWSPRLSPIASGGAVSGRARPRSRSRDGRLRSRLEAVRARGGGFRRDAQRHGQGPRRGADPGAGGAAGTTSDAERTQVIAWYTMLQDLGHALGRSLAGLPSLLAAAPAGSSAEPAPTLLLACAALACSPASCTCASVRRSRAPAATPLERLGAKPRDLFKISALVRDRQPRRRLPDHRAAVVLLLRALRRERGRDRRAFFGARLINAVSHLGAAWLARRIGLVNTMVFTHIPSSLLLATSRSRRASQSRPCCSCCARGWSRWTCRRGSPTCSRSWSRRSARSPPASRTWCASRRGRSRRCSRALLMTGDSMHLPLVIGAAMKIGYDLLLWRAFRGLRPPEEAC